MPPIAKSLRRDRQRRKARSNRTESRAFLLILDEQNAKRDRTRMRVRPEVR